jgi:hypothetical protein
MDFVRQMLDGRAFRVLTVINQSRREIVSLGANFRLTGPVGGVPDETWTTREIVRNCSLRRQDSSC